MTTSTMPAAFLGHGSPMNTLEHNRFTDAWAEFGASIDKPKAVLAISAHWFVNASAVTSMDNPPVIHDFYGFPQELFEFNYPAPGSPILAHIVAEIAKPTDVHLDDRSWGIDHGTWSLLAHVLPHADVPVVQLSIDATKPLDYHFDLGARLAPLLDEGVMILASGNVVHNLRRIQWDTLDHGATWAQRFDDATRDVVVNRPSEIGQLLEHPDYAASSPTPDHFVPLAYLAGIAAATGARPTTIVEGCTMGSLSMTGYRVDVPAGHHS